MKYVQKAVVFGFGSILLLSSAWAHPGHELTGSAAGLAHPFQGLDHLLAMLAVGVWAARQPRTHAWIGPAVFLAALAAGAGIGLGGAEVPLVETGTLASVVLLGLMIIIAGRVPAAASLAALGFFALLHGFAHGQEAVAPVAAYVTGFLGSSALLHALGFTIGLLLTRTRFGLTAAGMAFAGAGAALLASG